MKKALSLLLALVMCLSLCACGEQLKDTVIGAWEHSYTLTEEELYDLKGDIIKETLEFYKGGTGVLHRYNTTRNREWSDRSFTWEIQDDVVNVRFNESWLMTFTYNKSDDTITRLQDKGVLKRIALS